MSEDKKDIHNSDVPALCRSCEARHRGIRSALNAEQLSKLNRVANRKEFSAGTELVGDSEEFQTYSNVLSGVVKLTKTMMDGREQIVGLQFAPDFLGRPFHKESHVSAEAASTVQLCMFPKSSLEAMLKDSGDLKQRMLEQTLTELDEARDWMLTLGRKTAAEKVASFVYMIAKHIDPEADQNEQQDVSFDLPLTRADMADYLGLTVETVSRQLTKLRKSGVVEIEHNRHFRIPDMSRLGRFSGV